MSQQHTRRTFISYSRINKDFALKLALELRNSGFDIWLDQLDIPTGSRWDDEVERALGECEIFMVILTPASSTSDNVKDEIGYAIDAGKRILPILLENAKVPLRLIRFQYVDFTKKSYEEGVDSAKQLLRRLIDEPTLPMDQVLEQAQIDAREDVEAPKASTAPISEKRQPAAAPPAKKSSLPMLLGVVGGAGLIIILAFFMLRGSPGFSEPVEPVNTTAPTQTPLPAQPTRLLEPSPVPETPTAESNKYDLLEFNGEEDLQSWPTFTVDGRRDPTQPIITTEEFDEVIVGTKDGLYFFEIDRRDTTVYSYYDSFGYEDVRVDVRIDSRNINVNKASLFCRYSPELGWYEFRIANNGPYGIYFAKPNEHGLVNYRPLADGNSRNTNAGNAVNEYSIICKGDDTLELYINGELTRTTSDLFKVLRTGKVGISVSSITNLPAQVGVDWVKISEPE